jgi:hypothetical protein
MVALFRKSTVLTLYTLVAIPVIRSGPVVSGDAVGSSFRDVAFLGVISRGCNLVGTPLLLLRSLVLTLLLALRGVGALALALAFLLAVTIARGRGTFR